jgi:hypothetical protein
MVKVIPVRADQLRGFFKIDGTPRSVRTINGIFEGKKTAKDTRAALVAKDLDNNNTYSTSQLQIEPDLPATFSAEQSTTFYTDLKIGFDGDDHAFGTKVANGILNIDNERFVRQRTVPPDTANDEDRIDTGGGIKFFINRIPVIRNLGAAHLFFN